MKYSSLFTALILTLACNRKPQQERTNTPLVVQTEVISEEGDSASTPSVEVVVAQDDEPRVVKIRTRINVINLLPKTPPSRFTLPAGLAKDTILETPKGTQVSIEANSLRTKNGKAFNGPVEIKICDYPTASSAALAGLSTETTDGKLLRTRGMAKIQATSADGEELEMMPGRSIGLRFKGPEPVGYSAYEGVQTGPNFRWKLRNKADKARKLFRKAAENPSTDVLKLGNVEMRMPMEGVFSVAEQMPEPPYNIQKYLADSIFYTPEAFRARIEGIIYVNFIVAKDGSILEPSVRNSIDGGLSRVAMRIIALMPKWTPGKQGDRTVPVRISLPVRFAIYKGVRVREGRVEIPNNSWSEVETEFAAKTYLGEQGFTRFANLGYCNIDQLMKQQQGAQPLWVEVLPKMNEGKGLTAFLIAKNQQVSVSRDFEPGQTRMEFPRLSPQPLTLVVFSADSKGKVSFARSEARPGQTLSIQHFTIATPAALDSLRNTL